MVVNIAYTNVRYHMWEQSKEDEKIADRIDGELNIYGGRMTSARIAREIPKGATVDIVSSIKKRFDVDCGMLLNWLTVYGTEKK